MIVRSSKRKKSRTGASKLAMTPMIDIVFQLLIFFILTFKVVPQEGGLYVAAGEEKGKPTTKVVDAPLPLKLILESNDNGELVGIQLNKKKFKKLEQLQKHLIAYFGDDRGPESLQAKSTLEIAADSRLKHMYMIKAIDAVSGYKVKGKLIRLVTKLKLSAPSP